MSTPRLERQNGIIAGVCGGIAARYNWDPTIVRIIFGLMLLPGGVPGLVVYLVLWLLMPARR